MSGSIKRINPITITLIIFIILIINSFNLLVIDIDNNDLVDRNKEKHTDLDTQIERITSVDETEKFYFMDEFGNDKSIKRSPSRGQYDYDLGIDPVRTNYESGGIDQWDYISVGEVGKPTLIHTGVINYGNIRVEGIIVSCNVYLWLDIGPLNSGPLIFTQTFETTVDGGFGQVSEDITFQWTPTHAHSYMINIDVDSIFDPDIDNNGGWFPGLAFKEDPNSDSVKYFSGMYVDSWSNTGIKEENMSGDIGSFNEWHIVDPLPIPSTGGHSSGPTWWCGNDSTTSTEQVRSTKYLITEKVSLRDYDQLARDPEDPMSLKNEPQIFFNYKWAGNISLSSGGGIFTYISDDDGETWEPIITDDAGNPKGANGTTYDNSIGKYQWNFWTYETNHPFERYGIPIGDHIGKDVRFMIAYFPGSTNSTKDIGYFIDDLIVWGRQSLKYIGFTVSTEDPLNKTLDPGQIGTFNFSISNVELRSQQIRIGMKNGPLGWDEGKSVMIDEPLFSLFSSPDHKNITISVIPPENARAGIYDLIMQFTGNEQVKVNISIKIIERIGFTFTSLVNTSLNSSGEIALFDLILISTGNTDQNITFGIDAEDKKWASLTENDKNVQLYNITLIHDTHIDLVLKVRIPEEIIPDEYIFTVWASSNNSINRSLKFNIAVKRSFDLELTIANSFQKITKGNGPFDQTIKIPILIKNKGNYIDMIDIQTIPMNEMESLMTWKVEIENNTIFHGQIKSFDWTIELDENTTEGYHNYSIILDSSGPDKDLSDNEGFISILVVPPIMDEIFNFSVVGPMRTNIRSSSTGFIATFSSTIITVGNVMSNMMFQITSPGSLFYNETQWFYNVGPGTNLTVSFTIPFSNQGIFNISLLGHIFSNETKELKLINTQSSIIDIGTIDLSIIDVKIFQNDEEIRPKEDEIIIGSSALTIIINMTNNGNYAIDEALLTIQIIDGINITEITRDETIKLKASEVVSYTDYYILESVSTEIRISIQLNGQDILDSNMSNNKIEHTYFIFEEDNDPSSNIGMLLIIIALVFFTILVYIVFLIYYKRQDISKIEKNRDKENLNDLEEEEDDELEINFIDDDEDETDL